MPRNVAQACRHFSLSRETIFKWKARYKSRGDTASFDRPRVPLHSPRSYAPRRCFHRIADYLRRLPDVNIAGSSVHRILIRHRMNRLPANHERKPAGRAWQRYEKPHPEHRLQLDAKSLDRIAGARKRLYERRYRE